MKKMFTADFITKTEGYVRRAIFSDDKVSAYQQAHRMAAETGEHFLFASIREVEGEFEAVVHSEWAVSSEYEYFCCKACGANVWNGADCRTEAEEMLAERDNIPKRCPECGAHMSDQAYTPKPHFQP